MAYPTKTPAAIRADIVARLTAASLPGSPGVYNSRSINVDQDELPAVSVFSVSVDDEQLSLGARVFKRTETIGITARLSTTTDDGLALANDAMEAAILGALLTDREWNVQLQRASSEKGVDIASNKRVGGVDIKIVVTYSPSYEIDLTGFEFEEVAVTTEPTDPDGADVSERVWELDQP
jgi:hypothetical protein